MVNGNYILYGDRAPSEAERMDNNNVHTRSAERKNKRKVNRSANELQHTLNLAQIDNDTDSIKYERAVKEPRLVRYIPSTDVEENFVNDKYETYDMKASEEPARRYAFAKKPKNPADGSAHYAYSRSSSNCSSPNANLPTISEHGEQYGTFRARAPSSPSRDSVTAYDQKLDKYFSRPRELKPFTAKGSHPDSLYRVPAGGVGADGRLVRAARLLRWPAALLLVCIALAVFVYFLMPDSNDIELSDMLNSTSWSKSTGAHLQHPDRTIQQNGKESPSNNTTSPGTKASEIDFYDSNADVKYKDSPPPVDLAPDLSNNRKLPIPPVFPSHIVPEVQYGNERADSDKNRTPKVLQGQPDKQPEDSTIKPHITQKPEKPLAIYFKDGAGLASSSETFVNEETSNNFTDYNERALKSKENTDNHVNDHSIKNKNNININKYKIETEDNNRQHNPNKSEVHFTSGHSNLFGLSVEDAEKIKSTTQSSLYNTRVSPTLPVWRDMDDTTTKHPVNVNAESGDAQPQCRSTHLPLCRGVLPYDLTSAPVVSNGKNMLSFIPQFEYLLSANCSQRLRQFACVLLEPECNPPPLKPRKPCFNLCRAVMDGCEHLVPHEMASIVQCNKYPLNNCVNSRSPCFDRELECGDGSCVPRDWICDGTRDCPGGDDEAICKECNKDEFNCPSGGCIKKRWLCDGYNDCPEGEDEQQSACRDKHGSTDRAEIGEEFSASAPAASVRKPNRLPAPHNLKYTEISRGDDSSSELLMTSDTSHPYRRNYTRRPNTSRLTPYKRPIVNDARLNAPVESTTVEKETDMNPQEENNGMMSHDKKAENDEKFTDDLGDMSFFTNFENEMKNQQNSDGIAMPHMRRPTEHGRAPGPMADLVTSTIHTTRLDKSMNRFERVINGAELIRKKQMNSGKNNAAAADYMQSYDDGSAEGRESKKKVSDSPRNETLITAHASPCPSGELRCVDGRCITLAQLCDGTIDCTDHADEDNCYT